MVRCSQKMSIFLKSKQKIMTFAFLNNVNVVMYFKLHQIKPNVARSKNNLL
jgi:hypothetical protein